MKKFFLSFFLVTFLSLISYGEQSVFELFNDAYLHYERRQFEEAVDKFELVQDKFPDTEWAVAAQYYQGLSMQDKREAIGLLSSLVENKPDSPYAAGARLTAGEYSFFLGDYQEAREYLEKYIEVSENVEKVEEAHRFILRSFLAEEQYDDFYAFLEEAKDKYTDWEDDKDILWYEFMVAFSLDDFATATALGEDLIEEHPENPYQDRVYYYTAQAYEAKGEDNRARYYLNLLEDEFPRSSFSARE